MGGRSSSNSTSSAKTSTVTETINANSTDNEGLSVIADGAVNVNITPSEAFQLVADVTTNAVNAVRSANEISLAGAKEFAEQQNKEVLDFATANANPDSKAAQSIVKYAALASIAYAGFKFYGKKS